MRLVGGRWRDGAVVGQEDEGGREHRRAKEDRDAPVAQPVDDSPQRVQRIQGDTHGDEQVREAELHVRDEKAPHAEQDERRRQIEGEVPREESGARVRFEVQPDRCRERRRARERRRKPEDCEVDRNVTDAGDPRLHDRDQHQAERDHVRGDEPHELRAIARRTRRDGLTRSEAPAPAVEREHGDDRDRGNEAQVRADVPVGRGLLERGKPAQRVQPEDLIEYFLRLPLERIVQRARRHGAEDERFDGADADQEASDEPHPPVARHREPVRHERRGERKDIDEIARGRCVSALPVVVEREPDQAETERGRGRQERAAARTQRGGDADHRDEEPRRDTGDAERPVEEHAG